MRMQAMRAGAVEFLGKPFDDEMLLETVRAALEYLTLRNRISIAARVRRCQR